MAWGRPHAIWYAALLVGAGSAAGLGRIEETRLTEHPVDGQAVFAQASRGGSPHEARIHQRIVKTTRGSTFSLCERSRTDPAYPRYPRLPVTACVGHEPRGHSA